MGNVLSDEKKQQVLALGRLGWPLRRIEHETGVRRETSSGYLRAAGIAVRAPRRWGHSKPAKDPIPDPNPAKETIPDSGGDSNPAKEVIPDYAVPRASRSPAASSCEPHRDFIEEALRLGRNAKAIYQDLVVHHGYAARYASVSRFARKLRGTSVPEAHAVIVTAAGEEAQVDYGEGPMVRGDGELRRHFKDGIKLMMGRGINADAGQLLYLLDAYNFARFMRRFSTSRRAENYQTFSDPSRWERIREGSDEKQEDKGKLNVMQWQNTKAVKRTKHALPLLR